jgi:spore germination cell wall hydrolase CwlJ-like protein
VNKNKLSAAAKKAWKTRQKKYGKSGMKKHKGGLIEPAKEHTVYTVENGKVIPHKEPFIPKKPTRLYYSLWEAKQVAKHGPNWFMRG